MGGARPAARQQVGESCFSVTDLEEEKSVKMCKCRDGKGAKPSRAAVDLRWI